MNKQKVVFFEIVWMKIDIYICNSQKEEAIREIREYKKLETNYGNERIDYFKELVGIK